MTDEQHLTLEQLASTVGMTTRNVRAYQTRGLLQPPRRAGRMSVYGDEHVERLRQVQHARSRGASLQLLRTLIREGRDLDGVWKGDTPPSTKYIDVTETSLGHTPACLARLDVPLQPFLEEMGDAGDPAVRPALAALVTRGVIRSDREQLRAPGSLACAAEALRDQGRLPSAAAALQLAELIAEAAQAVTEAAATVIRSLGEDERRAAAPRLGELAGAVVEQVVGVGVAWVDEPV